MVVREHSLSKCMHRVSGLHVYPCQASSTLRAGLCVLSYMASVGQTHVCPVEPTCGTTLCRPQMVHTEFSHSATLHAALVPDAVLSSHRHTPSHTPRNIRCSPIPRPLSTNPPLHAHTGLAHNHTPGSATCLLSCRGCPQLFQPSLVFCPPNTPPLHPEVAVVAHNCDWCHRCTCCALPRHPIQHRIPYRWPSRLPAVAWRATAAAPPPPLPCTTVHAAPLSPGPGPTTPPRATESCLGTAITAWLAESIDALACTSASHAVQCAPAHGWQKGLEARAHGSAHLAHVQHVQGCGSVPRLVRGPPGTPHVPVLGL